MLDLYARGMEPRTTGRQVPLDVLGHHGNLAREPVIETNGGLASPRLEARLDVERQIDFHRLTFIVETTYPSRDIGTVGTVGTLIHAIKQFQHHLVIAHRAAGPSQRLEAPPCRLARSNHIAR